MKCACRMIFLYLSLLACLHGCDSSKSSPDSSPAKDSDSATSQTSSMLVGNKTDSTYHDKRYGYWILVPKGWTDQRENTVREGEKHVLTIIKPEKSIYRPNVTITVSSIPPKTSAKTLFEKSQPGNKKVFDKYKLHSDGPDQISGHEAYWFVMSRNHTVRTGKIRSKTIQFFVIVGDRLFVLTGSSPEPVWDDYELIFRKMIGSLRLKQKEAK